MSITLTGATPATAPITGGTIAYVTGTDLLTVTSITVGGTAPLLWEALSATLIRLTVPAHASTGAVSVIVQPGAVTLASAITYATPTGDEQLVSSLARKWKLDINVASVDSPTWIPVRAIGEIKDAVDPNNEDDTDYEADGWGSNTKTLQTWSLEVKLFRKNGVSSGEYDPGQEALRLAAVQFGAGGIVQVRWYDREGGPEAYSGFASVSWSPDGGDAKALSTVTAKLMAQGRRVDIVNPAA